MLQDDLEELLNSYNNHVDTTGTIFCQRELLTYSRDKRRLDLLTITSLDGASTTEHFPLLSGLFPDTKRLQERPPLFPKKDIIFVSARVHPGEVPAQHTFRGALTLLLDPDDTRAKELRARYVFILIPMLNPDGNSYKIYTIVVVNSSNCFLC